MADGGSPPLRDPGGLHMYNMNGSSHKMAELVMGENPAGHSSSLSCGQIGSSLGMYQEGSAGMNFTVDPSIHQPTPSSGFLTVEPLQYPEQGVYEELKRPGSQLQPVSPYYTNMDASGPSSGNMFEFPTSSEPYKVVNSSHMSGYVEMLGQSESMMNIKREKIDYNDTVGLVNSSNAADIPYPPNTCVPDWNLYNPNAGNGSFTHHDNQSAQFSYQTQPYANNMMYNSTQPSVQIPFQSNDDIHYQSKKITQSILNSEWGPDTLYKSQLYTNLVVDSNTRKRRAEPDKTRNGKTKRKKSSSDLSGHSKTVASILLSENQSPNNTEGQGSAEKVLDSADRNSLVSNLMDNIRSTVQFESFCLSFPRSNAKENAFRSKITSTADMILEIPMKDVKSLPFPSNFVTGAAKVITNFRNALKNTSNNVSPENENEENRSLDCKDLSMEQVEEHLPHSMVWVVKMGNQSLCANWEGQIVIGVNPVRQVLSISIFQFQPNFSEEAIKCLEQRKLTRDLANDITQNMEQFEVSRQLRCDINLKKIIQFYLHKPNGEENEGCLVIEMSENPQFYQRWLHTSAEDKNKWRQRQSFFGKSDNYNSDVLYIGGLVSELNEIVALVLACGSGYEELYEKGVKEIFSPQPKPSIQKYNETMETNSNHKQGRNVKRSTKCKGQTRRLGSNINKLRKEIMEVLVHHHILEQDSLEKMLGSTNTKNDKEENSVEISLGIKLDDSSSCCFQDYINYSCDSATDLNALLDKELNPRAYGFYENDFDMSKVPDENIDKMKIGELLSSKCSDVVYYSFCNKEVGQSGYDRHCVSCRLCQTMKYWHCETCDQCTESRSVCEFCGHLRNDQTRFIIKPLSVFKTQVSTARVIGLDDIKQEWVTSLEQPDDDILTLNPPKFDTNCTEKLEYNCQNAMIDQLGLLNPVGFLLGQPSVGASRKHRRYKGGQVNDIVPQANKKGGQSTGSGCSVQ